MKPDAIPTSPGSTPADDVTPTTGTHSAGLQAIHLARAIELSYERKQELRKRAAACVEPHRTHPTTVAKPEDHDVWNLTRLIQRMRIDPARKPDARLHASLLTALRKVARLTPDDLEQAQASDAYLRKCEDERQADLLALQGDLQEMLRDQQDFGPPLDEAVANHPIGVGLINAARAKLHDDQEWLSDLIDELRRAPD